MMPTKDGCEQSHAVISWLLAGELVTHNINMSPVQANKIYWFDGVRAYRLGYLLNRLFRPFPPVCRFSVWKNMVPG